MDPTESTDASRLSRRGSSAAMQRRELLSRLGIVATPPNSRGGTPVHHHQHASSSVNLAPSGPAASGPPMSYRYSSRPQTPTGGGGGAAEGVTYPTSELRSRRSPVHLPDERKGSRQPVTPTGASQTENNKPLPSHRAPASSSLLADAVVAQMKAEGFVRNPNELPQAYQNASESARAAAAVAAVARHHSTIDTSTPQQTTAAPKDDVAAELDRTPYYHYEDPRRRPKDERSGQAVVHKAHPMPNLPPPQPMWFAASGTTLSAVPVRAGAAAERYPANPIDLSSHEILLPRPTVPQPTQPPPAPYPSTLRSPKKVVVIHHTTPSTGRRGSAPQFERGRSPPQEIDRSSFIYQSYDASNTSAAVDPTQGKPQIKPGQKAARHQSSPSNQSKQLPPDSNEGLSTFQFPPPPPTAAGVGLDKDGSAQQEGVPSQPAMMATSEDEDVTSELADLALHDGHLLRPQVLLPQPVPTSNRRDEGTSMVFPASTQTDLPLPPPTTTSLPTMEEQKSAASMEPIDMRRNKSEEDPSAAAGVLLPADRATTTSTTAPVHPLLTTWEAVDQWKRERHDRCDRMLKAWLTGRRLHSGDKLGREGEEENYRHSVLLRLQRTFFLWHRRWFQRVLQRAMHVATAPEHHHLNHDPPAQPSELLNGRLQRAATATFTSEMLWETSPIAPSRGETSARQARSPVRDGARTKNTGREVGEEEATSASSISSTDETIPPLFSKPMTRLLESSRPPSRFTQQRSAGGGGGRGTQHRSSSSNTGSSSTHPPSAVPVQQLHCHTEIQRESRTMASLLQTLSQGTRDRLVAVLQERARRKKEKQGDHRREKKAVTASTVFHIPAQQAGDMKSEAPTVMTVLKSTATPSSSSFTGKCRETPINDRHSEEEDGDRDASSSPPQRPTHIIRVREKPKSIIDEVLDVDEEERNETLRCRRKAANGSALIVPLLSTSAALLSGDRSSWQLPLPSRNDVGFQRKMEFLDKQKRKDHVSLPSARSVVATLGSSNAGDRSRSPSLLSAEVSAQHLYMANQEEENVGPLHQQPWKAPQTQNEVLSSWNNSSMGSTGAFVDPQNVEEGAAEQTVPSGLKRSTKTPRQPWRFSPLRIRTCTACRSFTDRCAVHRSISPSSRSVSPPVKPSGDGGRTQTVQTKDIWVQRREESSKVSARSASEHSATVSRLHDGAPSQQLYPTNSTLTLRAEHNRLQQELENYFSAVQR